MKHEKIKPNFIYPEITAQHYRFGSNQFDSPVLREDGDWRDFVPTAEEQNKYGVESSACYVAAQIHAIATIQEERFTLSNQDYSSRFNALKSDGTNYGGDPLAGAESIRKNDGLIPEELMPFTDAIKDWSDFHSWKGSNQDTCERIGKDFLAKWNLNYDIVFTKGEARETKYAKLREALKRSPVPISVIAWYADEQGVYVKPDVQDNHFTLCVYLDEQNRPYFWDTYSPFLKIGEPLYNSDFAMRWSIARKEVIPSETDDDLTDMGSVLIHWFKNIINLIKKIFS